MKLTGDKNQCSGCKEYFNSSRAFDKHRTGSYGVALPIVKGHPQTYSPAKRRCRTIAEMIAKGMVVSTKGFWLSKPMSKGLHK